jgi:hydroxymethylbilane synthase
LAVQIRAPGAGPADIELAELVSKLDDREARITAQAERHILASMHGGCSIPLGVYSEIDAGNISIDAMISDLEGVKYIKRSITTPLDQALTAAEQLAQELLGAGGQIILDQIRAERCD